MSVLDDLKTTTLVDAVEERLLTLIQNANLQPGDALPKEEELAERLRVSRNVVREGISRLKMLGLVESRKRRGMVLARPNLFAGVSKLAEARLLSPKERLEFMGMRVVLELGMTDFVFARRTPEKLAELRRLAGAPNVYQELDAELAFHGALFALGGNDTASQFRTLLATAFRPLYADTEAASLRRGLPPEALPETDRGIPTHLDICHELEQGTAESFNRIMKAHFRNYMLWTEGTAAGEERA